MSPKLGAPRRACFLLALLLSLLGCGLFAGGASAAGAATETPDETFAASATPSGEFAEGGVTGAPSISADGRLVGFLSGSANLSPEGTATVEAYVKDLETGAVSIASRADGGSGAASVADVGSASLASGGRYLAFESADEGLVAGVPTPPGGPVSHVYRRDLQTGATTIVDRADGATGEIVPFPAHLLSISADGRLVAFSDRAQGLDDPVGPHTEGEETIYVRDLDLGTTFEVAAEGAEEAAFSDDDRYLLFTSAAPTLPETTGEYEVYRRDLGSGETKLVSRSNPTPAAPEGEPAAGEAYEASFVGANDCAVVFRGQGSANLVSEGSAPFTGVYVHDFCGPSPTTSLLSLDEQGQPFNLAVAPKATADGRIVFVAQDGSTEHLYLRDPVAGATALLDRASGPEGGPSESSLSSQHGATVAEGGCRAVFSTAAADLEEVERPASTTPQLFVRQLSPCKPAPEPPRPETQPETEPVVPPVVASKPPDSPAASGSATGPAAASSIRVTGAGRRGLWLAFDGAGRAFVRVQRQAPGGGWHRIAGFGVVATGPGVVHAGLPPVSGGPLRLKVRLQGDPDNPTMTHRIGGGGGVDDADR